MFVGHIGAGLIVKRVEPRLNVGALLFAALFADILLWLLVILGVESVSAVEVTDSARFFHFVFPYSHGLVSSIAWSILAAVVGWVLVGVRFPGRSRVALALAIGVASHFFLDLIVHVPDLPVLGQSSVKVGLGLWRHMPIALAVELLIAAVALIVFLRSAPLSRARAWIAGALVVVTAGLTAAGPYIPGDPPPAAVLGLSSLATLTVVVLLGFVVEGRAGVTAVREGGVGSRRAGRRGMNGSGMRAESGASDDREEVGR